MPTELPQITQDDAHFEDENPEWTEEDFAKARPPSEVLPPALHQALTKRADDFPGPVPQFSDK